MNVTEEDRRIVESAMRLAAERGWRWIELADIARESGVPLVRFYGRIPSKSAVLGLLMRIADETVLDQGTVEPSAGETDRDRLFEVLMRRFDALRAYRDGLRAVYRDLRMTPVTGSALGLGLTRSMGWMRTAAGVAGEGPAACVANAGLAAIYFNAFRVWLEDDTADLARTMAALDRGLRQGEGLTRFCVRRNTERGAAASASEAPISQGS